MCLYTRFIENPRYKPSKKNNGKPPVCTDERTKYIPVACGKCKECCKAKAREWRVRLSEEIKVSKKAKFVTLTFSNEALRKLMGESGANESNAIAKIAVRRFLERHRKKYKVSIRHWLITELGHTGTERIHLHGILFKDIETKELEQLWGYGFVHIGEYCNQKTINYIIKYATKLDNDHKGYTPIILTSKGIGANYLKSTDTRLNKYKENGETNESYRLPNGHKSALPIYYRNNIYSEEEREKLWIQKLDKQEIYLGGRKYKLTDERQLADFERAQQFERQRNKQFGYGDDSKEWKKKKYNVTFKMLQAETARIKEKKRVDKLLKNK